MKPLISSILLFVVFSLSAFTISAETQHTETATFKVYGNCEMCKSRIEGALKKNTAIKSAGWNQSTKILTVVYDPHSISLDQIHTLIADAGHDTDKVKASDASYKTLPGCCKYKRADK